MYGFRLTQEAKDEGFSGGTINATPLGQAFDVGEAISAGNGAFYTDDAALGEILRGYPALEPIPEDQIPKDPTLVTVPGADVTTAPTTGPWQPQNPPEEEQPQVSEVSAQHADEPATAEEAVKQGENVSGLGAAPTGTGSRFGSSSSASESGAADSAKD